MRGRLWLALLVGVVVALPRPSAAQVREPDAGSLALGGALGVVVADDTLHTGFSPDASAEFYLAPRVSVRGQAGWSRNRFVGTERRYLEQLRVGLQVLYNWEAEAWHPFVAVGVGLHRVRAWEDDRERGAWQGRLGLTVGGGVEYFARRTLSLRAEGLYHAVGHRDLPAEASGLALSIGLKQYF